MIGVEDEEHVQRMGRLGSHLVFSVGHGEHHVKEVLGVGQVIPRIGDRLADMALVRGSGYGACLGQQQRRGPTESRLPSDMDLR